MIQGGNAHPLSTATVLVVDAAPQHAHTKLLVRATQAKGCFIGLSTSACLRFPAVDANTSRLTLTPKRHHRTAIKTDLKSGQVAHDVPK